MTDALKAMVEAMWAEVERQKAADTALPWEKGGHIKGIGASRVFDPGKPEHGQITSVWMMGTFDLEKVARAGLLAIRPVHPLEAEEFRKGDFAEYALRSAIDAITAEAP